MLACCLTVANARPENWLAGFAGLLFAAVGYAISAAGAAFGPAGRRPIGAVALVPNALVFLGAGVALLAFFGPPR